jgi:hypothetical protein
MDVRPCGSTPSRQAPPQYFTGIVWQDPIIEAPMPPEDVRATLVRFDPGARTNWHTHPAGHSLYYFRCRLGTERGWESARSARRRRRLVSAEYQALARRQSGHWDGARGYHWS